MAQAWTQLKTFWDNVHLRQLTNVNDPGATTINDTVGLKAESVSQALFRRVVGIEPDLTDDDHLSVLFQAIVFHLEMWANRLGDTWRQRREAVIEEMVQLRQVTARKRVDATTSSKLVPTDDTIDGAVPSPTPWSDLKRFGHIVPNDPFGQPFIPEDLNT